MINSKKSALSWGLRESSSARQCQSIPACKGKTFVHDMKRPNDLERKANAKIIVIGEAPGRIENETGRPFTGQSGKKIEGALKGTGVDINDVYFTNVIKCEPRGFDAKRGKHVHRRPMKEEIASCRPLLEAEIAVIKPRVIVPMGATAVKFITGKNTVQEAKLSSEKEGIFYNGIPVLPEYHPAASAYKNAGDAMIMREARARTFEKATSFLVER